MARGTQLAAFAAMIFVWALIAGSSRAAAQALWQDGLEQAETLGLRITADPALKTEGAAAIKVATGWPTVIALTEVTDLDIEAAVLVYRADVRSRGLEGTAFLEMWCHFPDGGQYFSRGLQSTVSGDADWQGLETKFLLQEGQKPSRVTLNLVVGGRGTVWVDNLRLSREPLP